MKRVLSLLLVFAMCLSLCACGKSKAAQECEELILAIGDVSVDSKTAIEAAERAYAGLTADEKDSISASFVILEDARDAYYVEVCKEIFSKLNKAHEIADQFGTDLYALGTATKKDFDFGDEKIDYLKVLLDTVSIHLTEEEMSQGIEEAVKGHNLLNGMDADLSLYVANLYHVMDDLCLLGLSNGYKLAGKVTAARDALYDASVMMAQLDGVSSCAQQVVILNRYYEAINEFLDICLDLDYDMGQLGGMLESYQGYVETYTTDLEAQLGG